MQHLLFPLGPSPVVPAKTCKDPEKSRNKGGGGQHDPMPLKSSSLQFTLTNKKFAKLIAVQFKRIIDTAQLDLTKTPK